MKNTAIVIAILFTIISGIDLLSANIIPNSATVVTPLFRANLQRYV